MYVFRPQTASCTPGGGLSRPNAHNSCGSTHQTAKAQKRVQPRQRRERAVHRHRARIRDAARPLHRRLALEAEGDTPVGATFSVPDEGTVRKRLQDRLVQRRCSGLIDGLQRRYGGEWAAYVLRGDLDSHESMRRLCEAFGLRPGLEDRVFKATASKARAWSHANSGIKDEGDADENQESDIGWSSAPSRPTSVSSTPMTSPTVGAVSSPQWAPSFFDLPEQVSSFGLDPAKRAEGSSASSRRRRRRQRAIVAVACKAARHEIANATSDCGSCNQNDYDGGLSDSSCGGGHEHISCGEGVTSMESTEIASTQCNLEFPDSVTSEVAVWSASETDEGSAATGSDDQSASGTLRWRSPNSNRVLQALGLQQPSPTKVSQQQAIANKDVEGEASPINADDDFDSKGVVNAAETQGDVNEEDGDEALGAALMEAIRNACLQANNSCSSPSCDGSSTRRKANPPHNVRFTDTSDVRFFQPEVQSPKECFSDYDRAVHTKSFDGPSGHKAFRPTRSETMDRSGQDEDEEEWEDRCDDIADLMCQPRQSMMWSMTWS